MRRPFKCILPHFLVLKLLFFCVILLLFLLVSSWSGQRNSSSQLPGNEVVSWRRVSCIRFSTSFFPFFLWQEYSRYIVTTCFRLLENKRIWKGKEKKRSWFLSVDWSFFLIFWHNHLFLCDLKACEVWAACQADAYFGVSSNRTHLYIRWTTTFESKSFDKEDKKITSCYFLPFLEIRREKGQGKKPPFLPTCLNTSEAGYDSMLQTRETRVSLHLLNFFILRHFLVST